MTHIKCIDCNQLLTTDKFYKNKQNKSGFRHQCIICFRTSYVKLKGKKDISEYCAKQKICLDCGIEKPYTEFVIIKESKDGLFRFCKSCCLTTMKQHPDFENLDNYTFPTILCQRDKPVNDFRKYFIGLKDSENEYLQIWRKRPKVQNRQTELNNERQQSGKLNQYRQTYYNNKPQAKIAANMRSRIRGLLIRASTRKKNHTHELIGCSWYDLKMHLESLFLEGMSWENYGINGWHIDHIIPCNFFDLTKEDEQLKCFHFTNLQPLWAIDNILKRDKILI